MLKKDKECSWIIKIENAWYSLIKYKSFHAIDGGGIHPNLVEPNLRDQIGGGFPNKASQPLQQCGFFSLPPAKTWPPFQRTSMAT